MPAVSDQKKERKNGNGSLPWRSVPDSNRLPLAVLQACFRKHLPTILRAGLVLPGTPQIPASFALKRRREDSNLTMSRDPLPYLSRSRAHAIGPRHIYTCRLSGCQASLTSALPPRSHPAEGAGLSRLPGRTTFCSQLVLRPFGSLPPVAQPGLEPGTLQLLPTELLHHIAGLSRLSRVHGFTLSSCLLWRAALSSGFPAGKHGGDVVPRNFAEETNLPRPW